MADIPPSDSVKASLKSEDREREVFRELTNEWLRPMDIGGRDGSDHSAILGRLFAKGLIERKTRGSSRSYLYRNPAYVKQPPRATNYDRMMEFVRILASYPCAGVDQEPGDLAVCGKCSPCEAAAFLRKRAEAYGR